jgi:hypothetical protein
MVEALAKTRSVKLRTIEIGPEPASTRRPEGVSNGTAISISERPCGLRKLSESAVRPASATRRWRLRASRPGSLLSRDEVATRTLPSASSTITRCPPPRTGARASRAASSARCEPPYCAAAAAGVLLAVNAAPISLPVSAARRSRSSRSDSRPRSWVLSRFHASPAMTAAATAKMRSATLFRIPAIS